MNDYEKEHLDKLRQYLPECTVLLRSDGSFPIESPCKVALYGSGARNTIKGGTGSGEVNSRFFINIEQGLKERCFDITTSVSGGWLDSYDEIRLKANKKFVKEVKKRAREKHVLPVIEGMGAIMPEPEYDIPLGDKADIAVYVLSRISGEGCDRKYIKGDILLTDSEVRDILELNRSYDKFLLVLNTGGPVDLTPVNDTKNILVLSQLGVETGLVLADIILGNSYPSGKLTTTWSSECDYCDIGGFGDINDTEYKEGIYVGYRYYDTIGRKPMYPFGFGLGFTSFVLENSDFDVSGETVSVVTRVRNTGGHKGKETVQLYVSIPSGKLDQPYQTLAGFTKSSEINPGDSYDAELTFDLRDIASYSEADEAYILEAGRYVLRLGTSSRDTEVIGVIKIDETVVVKKARNVLGDPGFRDCKPEAGNVSETPDGVKSITFNASNIKTVEVVYGSSDNTDTSSAESHSDEELCYLGIGAFVPDGGVLSAIGNESISVAGAAGQTTHLLASKGIKSHVMADGPAGVRISRGYFVRDGKVLSSELALPESMQAYIPFAARVFLKLIGSKPRKGETIHYQYCTALPIGTAIAQSWNTDLAYVCGDIAGAEMERFNIDLWLAPALNIHRDIRCGRNFEYYSEDPLISGLMAAAVTNGVQSHEGRGTTIKHYAANNQETNRYFSNSKVSERAMREIYLKGFGICIRESQPKAVMTSYNLLNGIHTSESRSLTEEILRDEFGFKGIVMTDWVVSANAPVKGSVYTAPQPYKVALAGGDLFMPGCKADYDNLLGALKDGKISRKQLQINASRIINL